VTAGASTLVSAPPCLHRVPRQPMARQLRAVDTPHPDIPLAVQAHTPGIRNANWTI
jgi:hypothetical protein